MADWHDQNLEIKYRAHPAAKDQECWNDLLAGSAIVLTPGGPISKEQYRDASLQVIEQHWLQYEGQERDRQYRGWHDRRTYYVDDREIKVIMTEDNIINCFHEHYGLPHQIGRHRDPDREGERRREYIKRMEDDEDADHSFEVLKDDSGLWNKKSKRKKKTR